MIHKDKRLELEFLYLVSYLYIHVYHFLNLISQDLWCPYVFVSADITVPVYTSKTPPSSDNIVIVKLTIIFAPYYE